MDGRVASNLLGPSRARHPDLAALHLAQCSHVARVSVELVVRTPRETTKSEILSSSSGWRMRQVRLV